MKVIHKILATILLTSIFIYATDRLVEYGVGWLWLGLVIASVGMQVWLLFIPDEQ